MAVARFAAISAAPTSSCCGGAPLCHTAVMDEHARRFETRGARVVVRVDTYKRSIAPASWWVHSCEEMGIRFGRGVSHGGSNGTADERHHHARRGLTAEPNQPDDKPRKGGSDVSAGRDAPCVTWEIHTTCSSRTGPPSARIRQIKYNPIVVIFSVLLGSTFIAASTSENHCRLEGKTLPECHVESRNSRASAKRVADKIQRRPPARASTRRRPAAAWRQCRFHRDFRSPP